MLLLVAEGEQVGGEAVGGGGDAPTLHQVARAQQVIHAHVQAGNLATLATLDDQNSFFRCCAADLGLLYRGKPMKVTGGGLVVFQASSIHSCHRHGP